MTMQDHTPTDHHFYASSVAEWRTDTDIVKLIKTMKNEKLGFNLFYVPLPDDAPYEIKFYQPQVEGALWLGYHDTK